MRSISKLLGVAVALAVALTGCSNDDMTNTAGAACTATLTGSITAGYTCTVTSAYSASDGLSAVTITVAGSPSLAVAFSSTGALALGTFTAGGTALVTNGTSTYLSNDQAGNFSLKLNKITTVTTSASGSVYSVSGTLDATLPAQAATGASGSILLHVAFNGT